MSDSVAEPQAEILFERRGHLGVVILNRPKAGNALNVAMTEAMLGQLQLWAVDDAVQTVLVYGNGDRGLCAGGDITAIYNDIPAGGAETANFWQIEYQLNALISHYPKPYVPFMDGLVLGGGVGISAHGNVRVVTERTRCGMPETTIGFVPDVGGTLLLSRAPGETGTHAALTGAHLTGSDALFLGLADHFVRSENLPALAAALENEAAAEAVGRFSEPAQASELAAQQDWIDAAYASDDAEQIVRNLREIGSEFVVTIEAKSPTAVKVTLASLRRAAKLATLEEVLSQEYRVGLRFVTGTEMREGVRAQVIDKDRNPQWNPATLAEVSVADVEKYFEPLNTLPESKRELGLQSLDLQREDAS
ncbi:3-hydroxyisobutyryl-CoA hydrolase [Renibacterium salmoninarum ATCC 33209]|uniref:3-hydroxyisobutyryl-CoA hydrolase n=1 Tax=Renibacterium salmoninarum (strain ATCC 33209 / DSM 20767 / JCM 11484 / NBRC 15589 / NCIMB 2235) TaxID=288705 RepID=A9WQX7_RENSM|nr:enoyl-CoA hydratase/isomerase family protein [Renibacterium salmoninarum]ABY23583.1 3-hydroxyisobutyryl-CoA hydrolase [Renibacterium salmoninarum ATCC 33209]